MKRFTKRKGFTLIEVIGCTLMLSLIVVGVASASLAIDNLRTNTRHMVYLSLHNLNCMEELNQINLNSDSDLLPFYEDSEGWGTPSIETNIEIESSQWSNFTVYLVTIRSKMRESPQQLVSKYTMTNIFKAPTEG